MLGVNKILTVKKYSPCSLSGTIPIPLGCYLYRLRHGFFDTVNPSLIDSRENQKQRNKINKLAEVSGSSVLRVTTIDLMISAEAREWRRGRCVTEGAFSC